MQERHHTKQQTVGALYSLGVSELKTCSLQTKTYNVKPKTHNSYTSQPAADTTHHPELAEGPASNLQPQTSNSQQKTSTFNLLSSHTLTPAKGEGSRFTSHDFNPTPFSKFAHWHISILSNFLIFLFTYTGINKLIHHTLFYNTINIATGIQPISVLIAWAVPVIELMIAIALFMAQINTRFTGSKLKTYNVELRTPLLASFIIMTIFTIYIAVMLGFSNKLPCSCGGVISELSWTQHLVFNIILSVLCYIGWRLARRELPGNLSGENITPAT
ncbi:MAG: hypothetical protein QM764_20715 [Chitinophagaceae bacterium]